MPLRITVVGAGVIGMASAYQIQTSLPDAHVTVVADQFSPTTTSDVAAGFGLTVEIAGTPLPLQKLWRKQTFDHLQRIYLSSEAADAGISLVSGFHFFAHPVQSAYWMDTMLGLRDLTPMEQQLFPDLHNGKAYSSFMCESEHYLPWLTAKFQRAGGVCERRRLSNLDEVMRTCDLVVNCSGVGAMQLANDVHIQPTRGVIVRVRAPWIKHFIRYGSGTKSTSIYPGRNHVNLGTIKDVSNLATTASKADVERIIAGCARVVPSIRQAEFIDARVGLRPCREPIRLQREWRCTRGARYPVIHNYGHGGYGIALHWGCALHAARLVQETVHELQLKATTQTAKL